MSNIIQKHQSNSEFKLITEYDPKYCDELCKYAYTFCDIEGFYGEYNICPSSARGWEDIHDDWRAAIEMAEYKKKAGITKHLQQLLNFAYGKASQDPKTGQISYQIPPDVELLQKVIFKISDNSFKIEKDSGDLRRRGLAKARKGQSTKTGIIDNDIATKIAKELLNQ